MAPVWLAICGMPPGSAILRQFAHASIIKERAINVMTPSLKYTHEHVNIITPKLHTQCASDACVTFVHLL